MTTAESLPKPSLTIGTRTSKLALWQTEHIKSRLETTWPGLECRIEPFVTRGDKTLDKPLPQIGGKGLFTAELEAALRDGRIDIAVHSLKDLPIEDADGLTLGAITGRADARDALIAREGWTLDALPEGAVVGTSSVRRQAQLRAIRPDLVIKPIRGNVDTRIRKVQAGEYDAAILAAAGVTRLGLTQMVTEYLDMDVMLSAPGQGALAVQCRAGDEIVLTILAAIEDGDARAAVTAERAFLNGLGGGCSAPVAAFATVSEAGIELEALAAWPDGRETFRVTGQGKEAWALGGELAQKVIAAGGGDIIASLEAEDGARPLAGKRIVVTRAQAQAAELSRKLADLGAIPIEIPMIRIEPVADERPLEQAILRLESYDWVIFTSVNAVKIFWRQLQLPITNYQLPKIAAVGPATARALLERGVQPEFTPDEFVSEAVAGGMGDLTGQRILLPRAAIAGKTLPELLTAQGAQVDDVPIYRTLPAGLDEAGRAALAQGVDLITFTSGSTARNWATAVREAGIELDAPIACIGPITAAAAKKAGLTATITPDEYTIDGLVQAIINEQ